MRQRFETEQWLPFPVALVFAFFANPVNLAPLMPAWQHARIDEVTLVPPPPGPDGSPEFPTPFAGDGTQLLITARAAPGLPVRLPWLALIEDFRWNAGFCDLQVNGPFAYWRHCHSVRSDTRFGQSGALVHDAVEYELPLSSLSWMAAPFGQLAMRTMFAYRQKRATELLPRFAAKLQQHR